MFLYLPLYLVQLWAQQSMILPEASPAAETIINNNIMGSQEWEGDLSLEFHSLTQGKAQM